ncbi:ribosome small subunit-dependent GTPase A [Lapidilactobacillus achengensis]|uniref:Small ribosomal subunit biogenesis GTPase RsgA n=1 Tax=Lapidilactobacillus achengensis TaxID=2486000 RepID=A0ABW1US11_9LACO|nr:ribosome small subunit-dependent GTPase A [Lapidilactobacillus achengensis]
MPVGKIIKSISGFYDVLQADGTIVRTRARGNFRKQRIKPVVGDQVEFADAYLLKLAPRKNELVRPPIANIDQAIVVMSATEPEFSPNLLDRYLVYLASQTIAPLIFVSKLDLLSESKQAALAPIFAAYRQIGYPIFLGTTELDQDFAELRQALHGQETVVMGQSGAGKSTLLNHLLPQLGLATAEISTSLNRGKHTTRTVTLYPFAGQGLIADTPGFSSLELTGISLTDLPTLFPEFQAVATQCRFRGCLHLQEPDCAVKAAVTAGMIPAFRYEDYQQLHGEIAALKPTYR